MFFAGLLSKRRRAGGQGLLPAVFAAADMVKSTNRSPHFFCFVMTVQAQLQEKAKELLTEKKVDVIIGFGILETGGTGAVFITDPQQTNRLVWNDQCSVNLAVYLTRKEIKKLGKPGIVVKGCDAKAVAVLESESQIDRSIVTVIGIACEGMKESGTLQNKCLACDVHEPLHCDIVIGGTASGEVKPEQPKSARYAKLDKILSMPLEERLEYWKEEFSRCIKCYACRQSCPLCYCNVCVADKNRPVRIDTSATLKGNFAWNILRAFHLAGRCVGCSACTNACPAGIDLDLLNLTLAKAAEDHFQFRSGMERNEPPLIGSFSPDDRENFIQ
ncbi:MAG: 4Fe-4S dicluster domain-containing protein [Planctomycetaceae bacterium]|nr:4Fe-4S dicluster domain-containing protein [Planctomycetaceae bacterium]